MKAGSTALSAKAEIPFLTSLLFCTNVIGLSSKNATQWFKLLTQAPPKTEMYHNARQSHN